MTHATDIVAYTYKAEMLCPDCTLDALNVPQSLRDEQSPDSILETLAVAKGIDLRDERAFDPEAHGIDLGDERSFDSGDFPKVVFASMIEPCGDCDFCLHGSDSAMGCADELCHGCGELLV